MKSKLAIFLITLIICSLALVSNIQINQAQGTTNINGIITTNTTWTKAGSPYNLTGNTLVNTGATLTIEPGVIVNINNYYIMVNGTLHAQGNSNEQINFNNGKITFKPTSTNWDETTQTGCIIENAIINTNLMINNAPKISNNTIYRTTTIETTGTPIISNNTLTGRININQGTPTITNNNIFNRGIYIDQDSKATIKDNTISACFEGIVIIISNATSGGSTSLIERNLIENNEVGIRIQSITPESATPIIRDNTITNNGAGISIQSSTPEDYRPIFEDYTTANNEATVTFVGYYPVYLTIRNNNIYNNTQYNIETGISVEVDAAYNWWGTTNTTSINQTIYDFKYDFDLGRVNFVPILTTPNPQAPIYALPPNTNSKDSYEPDNNFNQYSNMTITTSFQSQQRSIYPANDTDYIRFQATPGTYTFFTASSFDTYGDLYNNAQNLTASDDDNGGNLQFKITQTINDTGVYFLEVKAFSESTIGPYTLYYQYQPSPDVSPTPSPTPTPTASPTPTPTTTPTPTPSPTQTPTPVPTPTPVIVTTMTPAPTPTPQPTLTPNPTTTPTPTPTTSPSPIATPTTTPQPTNSPTPTPTQNPTTSPNQTQTPQTSQEIIYVSVIVIAIAAIAAATLVLKRKKNKK